MREFAAMSILNVWYARFDVEDALARLKSDLPKKAVRQTKAQVAKARTRDSMQALAKLTTVRDRQRQIISDPPLIVPLEELAGHLDVDAVYWFIRRLFTGYTRTLPAYRRRLQARQPEPGLDRRDHAVRAHDDGQRGVGRQGLQAGAPSVAGEADVDPADGWVRAGSSWCSGLGCAADLDQDEAVPTAEIR